MSAYRADAPRDAPHVLVCSGLDPSGGAGFIADVRVAASFGARPVGVVTSLTVQNTVAVQQVQPVDPELVGTQLASLLGDVEVRAVKLGLIGSVETARHISYGLDLTAAPVVWDPVGAPSRGRVEFDAHALAEMLGLLRPHLRVITPNAHELALLANRQVESIVDAIGAAKRLVETLGGITVVVKGGHIEGDDVVDLIVDGERVEELVGKRIGTEDVHGTGCAFSTALATRLALGDDIPTACRVAKDFVAAQLTAAVRPGRGAPAVV